MADGASAMQPVDFATAARRRAALAVSQAISAGDLPRARSSLDALDPSTSSTGGGLSVDEQAIISAVIELISTELTRLEANASSS